MLRLQSSISARKRERWNRNRRKHYQPKTAKSRLSKENKDEIRLYYDERGLDRYFGLLDLGEIGGLWKNVAGRYEIDGKKVYAKQIYKNPKVFYRRSSSNSMRLLKKSLVTGNDLG